MKKTTKKKLVCTVNRKTWVRGTKGGMSLLLNDDGNMCCLGFLGMACGVPEKLLRNKGTPAYLSRTQQSKFPKVTSWRPFVDVNDSPVTDDAYKETRLQELAQLHGFSFRFVGK